MNNSQLELLNIRSPYSKEISEKLLKTIWNWMDVHDHPCAETACQSDRCSTDAYDLMGDLCFDIHGE